MSKKITRGNIIRSCDDLLLARLFLSLACLKCGQQSTCSLENRRDCYNEIMQDLLEEIEVDENE